MGITIPGKTVFVLRRDPGVHFTCHFHPLSIQIQWKIRFCSHESCSQVFATIWWRHQMETFSALLAICAGNSPVPGEFPAQRPVTRSFDVFCDLRQNKRFSKQSWGWWFETLSRPLWRHCNEYFPQATTAILCGYYATYCSDQVNKNDGTAKQISK